MEHHTNDFKNNGYQPIQSTNDKPQPTPPPTQGKKKWATFTYFGPETGIITTFFRNTNKDRL
jgi:hypothetical protein